MPVFQLTDELIFPPPHMAQENGLLAVGGDLSVKRLLLAYSSGIFPWFSKGDPILWWSPNPRYILEPAKIRVSRSLEKLIKRNEFTVTINKSCLNVIKNCASVGERSRSGTWITEEMIHAYSIMHELGYVHSVESWYKGKLAGGLYGVCLGKCFFGESMFFKLPNASKVAFTALARTLQNNNFELIDCQQASAHLNKFGANGIPREDFLKRLSKGEVIASLEIEPKKIPALDNLVIS